MASLPDAPMLHTSTVALVPPEQSWLPIQSARERLRDKGLYRWPPHINLLYPFVPAEHLAVAADMLAPAMAAIPPFDLTLDAFGVFGGRHRGVLYVNPGAPEELAALCQLQAALQAAIPQCDDQQWCGTLKALGATSSSGGGSSHALAILLIPRRGPRPSPTRPPCPPPPFSFPAPF